MTPAMPFDDLQQPPSTLLGSPAEFRACIARSKPRDSLAGHRGFVGLLQSQVEAGSGDQTACS
jgi:hypothetical protein